MDVKEYYKKAKTKKKQTKGKPYRYPRLLETGYRIALQKLFTKNVVDLVLKSFTPEVLERLSAQYQNDIKTDSMTDQLSRIIANIKFQVAEQGYTKKIAATAKEYADKTNKVNKRQVEETFVSVMGINPLLSDRFLIPLMEAHIDRNIDLITKMTDEYMSRIKYNIQDNIQKGRSTKDITAQIVADTGISERRAKLIGRDQIGKINGQLTQERHKEIGITKYMWITSMDERVRTEHAARHGKVFSYNDPPEDGNPGEPIQCRCIAQPVFDDFF